MKSVFRRRWYLFIPLILLAFIAFGFITMYLWNWLMPAIFNLPAITFWQTVGLLILSRLLLGGMGGHGKGRNSHRCHREMHEKWEKMTPEEREKFREHIHMHRPSWMRREQQGQMAKEA
ncbi:MAG TPA: hypothetical protein VFG54_14825 [Prolixibacteraceae bacterium]|nr:hypothetical protein [Prolixibacteraceae bacterium]